MTSPGIVARGLVKRFQPARSFGDWLRGKGPRAPVDALLGVDLDVAPAGLVGLVGPNGAGKSTLLRVLAGLVLPDAGSVTAVGVDSRTDDARYRRLVGYAVSDERSHFWRLSARENLRFFAALHGAKGADDRARRALVSVELEAASERPVREFSTGMRQRLALARALLGEPAVLLLDEPTRGLDPGSASRFRTLVQDELVGRRGVTVVYATHDVLEMRDFCPELILLRGGTVLARGPAATLEGALEAVYAP